MTAFTLKCLWGGDEFIHNDLIFYSSSEELHE